MPDDDKDIFNKAEADLRRLGSELQITSQELLTVFLLIIAKDVGVVLPDTFSSLTTNYAAFLKPNGGDLNDEKLAIRDYLGRVGTDLEAFQYVLCTKIAQQRAIASIQAAIPVNLPAAPYIAPRPKKPNPPPAVGLAVSLSAPTTATVGVAITLSATVAIPPGRAVTKVEFYDGATKIGEDTTAPYSLAYSFPLAGNKTITARVFDDSPSPVVSVSNSVVVSVATSSNPTTGFYLLLENGSYLLLEDSANLAQG